MNKSYGEKIKLYRVSKEMTQEQLAEQLTISVSMLRMIETGQRKPNATVQKDIYNLTGILYTEEVKNEIEAKIKEIITNYIANEIKFFTTTNVTTLIRLLSEVNILNHPQKGLTVITPDIANVTEEQKYVLFNIVELLNTFAKNSIYDINSIYGNNIEFIKYYLPTVIEVISKSATIMYKNKEIPLYETLPTDIKKKTITKLLSEDYFLDKSKFAYIIQDNSMFPKYEKGYTVVAIECHEINTSGDVIVSINNKTPILRKISSNGNTVILESYNPEIPTEIADKKDVKILGKIIEVRFY